MLVLKGLVSYAYHMLFLISVTPKDYPYMWHTGKWDDCSIPCGSGNQTRDVYCAKSDRNRTSSEYCSETKLPAKYIADVTENSVVTFAFYFSFVTYSLNE